MSTAPSRFFSVKAWLSLLRVPNLFTVPGDPLAGYFLAVGVLVSWGWQVAVVMLASLLFYAAGLLLNDVADQKYDAQHHSSRPIPAGTVCVRRVVMIAVLMLVFALGLCAWVGVFCLYVGLGLTGVILLYDFVLKAVPVAGALCMGLCRGLSLLLGASVCGIAPNVSVIAAALLLTIYIAAVTHLAKGEREVLHIGFKRWLPLLAFMVGCTWFQLNMPELISAWQRLVVFISILIVVLLARVGLQLGKASFSKGEIPHCIGRLIAAVILIQVMFIIASGHSLAGILILCLSGCVVAHYLLARIFYAS